MSSKKSLDPLIAAFGAKSTLARTTVAAIGAALKNCLDRKSSGTATCLFEAWRNQFGLDSISDRRMDVRRKRIDAWRRKWLGDAADFDPDLFLFSAQSYSAAVLKLIAARLAGPIIHGCNDANFWRWIESGDRLRERGIDNVVNGDVFQAFVHANDRRLFRTLTSLVELAANTSLDASTTPTGLRSLHLDLFPREIRHALGEYYTPPFLVEHVLDSVGLEPEQRILDPMCGGGAFLAAILVRRQATSRTYSPKELLHGVAGIELHPLAALTARAALLSSITGSGDPSEPPELTIPVHLGDAITAAWRKRSGDGTLHVSTPTGVLELADDTSVERRVAAHLESNGLIGDVAAMVADARTLATLPEFDFVVGNPPWVGWESLPHEYRLKTAPIWREYGLFQQRGMEAILGGGKKDLSMLATYAAADAWLKPGGTLGFVVTESAFKSVGAARGFRRFQIGGDQTGRLQVLHVDDLTKLDPFANAATRSTVFVLKKGQETKYPVSYTKWSKSGKRTGLARPLNSNDSSSPWVTASAKVLPLLSRLLGPSSVRAYEGINTGGANGVYWLRILERTNRGTLIVENDPGFGRSDSPMLRAEIESKFVYPLLRHQDVGRWRAKCEISVLMLQDPKIRSGVDLATLEAETPLTLKYIRSFETQLRSRAAYKRYFVGRAARQAPFYSMFNFGTYTLAPIKVVWRRMTAPLEAAVVTEVNSLPVLPQETLCFIPCAQIDEACYYAGLLNLKVVNVAALASTQGATKSFGAPHLLKHVCLPTFNETLESHRRVVEAAKSMEGPNPQMAEALDETAAEIYGFTSAELKSLAEEYEFLLSK